jgi:hypothetical protein
VIKPCPDSSSSSSDNCGVNITNDLLNSELTAVECLCHDVTDAIVPPTYIGTVYPDFISNPTNFRFGEQAHEWNGEVRLGYTFAAGCRDAFQFTPYSGVGYEGGRMNVLGRQRYWWWYVPVGFVASYDFWGGFGIELDADFGVMGRARYVALDEPPANNTEREMSSRYRWELELPLYYTWDCCFCEGDGQFSVGVVPFWHGWRTKALLQGEQSVTSSYRTGSLTVNDTVFDQSVSTSAVLVPFTFGDGVTETQTFSQNGQSASLAVDQQVITYDTPVASPAMLNNSWGGRLEVSWGF